MTALESILKNEGPMISSELARRLAAKENIPANTASQRISRSKELNKINGFLKSGQSLVYLQSQVKEGIVYPVLAKIMQQYGEKYWHTLNAIQANGGSIDRKFLECYTSYPITPLASHIPFDEVMRMFVTEGILVANQNEYAFAAKFHPKALSNFIGKMLEQIKISILEHFASQVRNIGLVSYETGEFFAEYGSFRWGFKGVCPVIGVRKGKSFGFVLADIMVGRPIYERDVSFFLAKLAVVQSYSNSPRILPYLIVDNLHPDAMRRLKEKGVIIGFINELFGEKYAEMLKELIAILKHAAESLTGSHPDKYLDLIKELRKYNSGLLNNIRGALFEYMAGHLHVMRGAKIEIGREIFDERGMHEMDVKAEYYNKVVFAECKATKAPMEAGKINEWITKRVPAFNKWFLKQENFDNLKPEFEYWSTSGFTEDALEKLKAFQAQGKYKINIIGPAEIRQLAEESRNKKLKDALNTFYLNSKV
ncbi:hypothetical protein [Mucilaginibacter phyllosphaerae]